MIVSQAIMCGIGVPIAWTMATKFSGPFSSLAKPWAKKPYPTISRSGIGAQRASFGPVGQDQINHCIFPSGAAIRSDARR